MKRLARRSAALFAAGVLGAITAAVVFGMAYDRAETARLRRQAEDTPLAPHYPRHLRTVK